jgi:hypothetical protein
MTDPELLEMADLWQAHPDSEAAEDFAGLAARARRKAKLIALGDAAWLVLVTGSMVVATLLRPSMASVLVCAVTIAVVLWLNWRRRALRKASLATDVRNRAAFLDLASHIARSNLRRVTLSLATFLPMVLVAILFRVVTKTPESMSQPFHAVAVWATSFRGVAALAGLTFISALALRSRLRLASELRRLEALGEEYADEARRDRREGA